MPVLADVLAILWVTKPERAVNQHRYLPYPDPSSLPQYPSSGLLISFCPLNPPPSPGLHPYPHAFSSGLDSGSRPWGQRQEGQRVNTGVTRSQKERDNQGGVFKEGYLNLRHGPLMQAGETGRGEGLNRLFRNHLFFLGGPKLQGGSVRAGRSTRASKITKWGCLFTKEFGFHHAGDFVELTWDML